MKLGLVGPSDSVNKIEKDLKEIDTKVEIKSFIREKVVDSIEVIEECESQCDAILFSGVAVCEFVKSKYNITKPYAFVDRSGSSIAKALWEMKNDNLDLNKFSIDVVDNETIDDMIDELEVKPEAMYCLPFSMDIDEMEYVNWHIDLYERKDIDVIITGFGAVYNELKKRNYPVYRLQATKPLVKVSYNKIKSECALSKAQYSQIAVEILSLDHRKDNTESYYSDMLKRTEVEKYIVEYVRGVQGSLFSFGRNEFVIFANKGMISQDLNYSRLSLLKKEIKNIGFTLSVGIGIGLTSYQAETNARKALRRSHDSKGNDVFQVDEEGNLKGPLGSQFEISYPLLSADENIMDISQKTGLSCESVLKLKSLNEARKSNVYDSKELADCLDVSERTARRILKKITEANLGRVFAKESSSGTGRPKSLIELLF